MSSKYILFFLLVFASVGCKQEVVSPDELRQQVDLKSDGLQFLFSTQNPSSSDIANLRLLGMESQSSISIYYDANCASEIISQTASSSIVDIALSFTIEGDYPIYYVYTDNKLKSGNCKYSNLTYTYDSTAPAALTFSFDTVGGTTLTDNELSALVDIAGIEEGSKIKVFLDNDCNLKVSDFSTNNSDVTKEIKVYLDQNTLTIGRHDGSSFDYGDNFSLYYDNSCTNIIENKFSTGNDFTINTVSSLSEALSFYFKFTDETNQTSCLSIADFYGYNNEDQNLIVSFSSSAPSVSEVDEGDFNFYYTIQDSAGNGALNCIDTGLTYTLDSTAPELPTTLSFDSSLNIDPDKQLIATNIEADDNLKIFSDNSCTTQIDESDSEGSSLSFEISSGVTNDILNYYFIYQKDEEISDCLRVGNYTFLNTSNTTLPVFDIKGQPFVLKATNIDQSYGEIEIYTNNACTILYSEDSTTNGKIDFNFDSAQEIISSFYFIYKKFGYESNCEKISNFILNNSTGNNEPLFRYVDYVEDNTDSIAINFSTTSTDADDTITFYSDSTCSSLLIAYSDINNTTPPSIDNFSEGITNIYYKLEDASENYTTDSEGNDCISANMQYELDEGVPTDHKMNMIAPTFLLTQDQNVALTNIELSQGTFTFFHTIVGETLNIYGGKDCQGSAIATTSITSTTTDVVLNYNELVDNYISYETTSVCENFNFRPLKKDGIENTVTFSFSGLEVDTSLEIFSDNACSSSLHTSTVMEENPTIDVKLNSGGNYTFSSRLTDSSGNEGNCISSDSDGNSMSYNYRKVLDIAVGQYHTCALVENENQEGKLYCWGRNNNEQLGEDSAELESISYPYKSSTLDAEDIASISAYNDTNCFLDNSTDTKCFGDNSQYQFGDNTNTSNYIPQAPSPASPSFSNYSDIQNGKNHTCAITNTNDMDCWGYDNFGGTARGTVNTTYPIPQDAPALASNVNSISLGSFHSCLINSTQDVACWGLGASGQLGDGTNQNLLTVPAVLTVYEPGSTTPAKFSKVELGADFTCALTDKGIIMCWGSSSFNQLGGARDENDQNVILSSSNTPVKINSDLEFIDLSAADDQACALDKDNFLYCWGNGYDEIQKISEITKYSMIEVGINHTCALTTEGKMHCWGLNNFGQLGNSNTIGSLSPVEVDFDIDRTQVVLEDSNSDQITSIDLKKDVNQTQNTVMYYDNTTQSYKTMGGDDEVTFDVTLTNTSPSDAEISGITLSKNLEGSDLEDYTDYFDITNNCNGTLSASSACSETITFTPTIPRPEGMTVILNVTYSDNDRSYIHRIPVTGYSERSLSHIAVFDANGTDLDEPLVFNSDGLGNADSVNATLIQMRHSTKLSDNQTSITITNPYTYKVFIRGAEFVGADASRFNITGSTFPGTSGTCSAIDETLDPYESCTIDIEDNNSGSEPNAYLQMTYAKYTDQTPNEDENIYSNSFKIKNTGGEAYNINSIAITGSDGDQFRFTGGFYPGINGSCADSIAAGSECDIEIEFAPTEDSGGLTDAKIKIGLSDSTQSSFLEVMLEGDSNIYVPFITSDDDLGQSITGQLYELNTYATRLNSGSISRYITIYNNENTGLSYPRAINMQYSLTGTDSSQFSIKKASDDNTNATCSTTLAPEQSCTIEIIYEPSATSLTGHEATLEINMENENHSEPVNTFTQDLKAYSEL